jgi:hypothetical protein
MGVKPSEEGMWLHPGESISCDHTVSSKGLSSGTSSHVTCNIHAQSSNSYRNKRHLPLQDRS